MPVKIIIAGLLVVVTVAVVLTKPWRMFAPLEALTGILMSGLSTGLFFALASRWINQWMQRQTEMESHVTIPSKLT